MTHTARPSFLIVGAMKAGTTSLFRWLGEHPAVRLPEVKEPEFFADDSAWARGPAQYLAGFPRLDPGQITGEASVAYTHPAHSTVAAKRAAEVLPDARIVYLVRDPVERMRSEYGHQVQRGRERRTFPEALRADPEGYAGQSRYDLNFRPWQDAFPADRRRVVRFEELVGESPRTWDALLTFLGLSPMARPTEGHNATAAKAPYRRLTRVLFDAGLARPLERIVPRRVKRALRPLFLGRKDDTAHLAASAKDPVSAELTAELSAGLERLLASERAAG